MNTVFNPSLTYPKGFLDFLTLTPSRGHAIGNYEMQQPGMDRLNSALAALSPESPRLTLDQVATAAQRALTRYRPGQSPAFVTSRLAALERLHVMAADQGWGADSSLADRLKSVDAYAADPARLIPVDLPVVSGLDVAVLVDVLLQLVREDLADYEDFCRFRQVAADFARLSIEETGLTRAQWMEALQEARLSPTRRYGRMRPAYVPDPRATLFHVA